jgi:hypothetical protein
MMHGDSDNILFEKVPVHGPTLTLRKQVLEHKDRPVEVEENEASILVRNLTAKVKTTARASLKKLFTKAGTPRRNKWIGRPLKLSTSSALPTEVKILILKNSILCELSLSRLDMQHAINCTSTYLAWSP